MRRAPLLLAILAVGVSAHSAQPEAPAPGAAARLPAAPIGRLFFSPTERSQLDVARIQKKAPAAAAPQAVEAPPVPEVVTYGGLVRRSDGRQMLWLNNRLVDAKEGLAGMSIKGKVRPDGAVTLQSPSGATVDLKVGQSVELYTGKIAETRKPPPEQAKPATEEGKSTEGPEAAGEPKPPAPAVAAKPPATEAVEKKPPPPGGTGLKMDLGGRALSSEEAARLSSK